MNTDLMKSMQAIEALHSELDRSGILDANPVIHYQVLRVRRESALAAGDENSASYWQEKIDTFRPA